MTQWGRPVRLRVDNGSPWGTQSVVPSALALWLVGLGVLPVYGRPARSTDNAVVERSHGVLAAWVEPARCADFASLQSRVTWAVHTQRERYHAVNGQPRVEAFPDLLTNPRPYALDMEATLWQMERVKGYLSQFVFRRKVEPNGRVTLFANSYTVGRAYSRSHVTLQLNAESGEWVVQDEHGQELRRLPAHELDEQCIQQLQLGKRRKP